MAISLIYINVVVPVTVIEAQYPGGLDAYRRDCPNRTFNCDGRLTRVSFMSPFDTERFVTGLEQKGLVPMEGDTWKDVAVIAQPGLRPTQGCSWIATGRMTDGCSFACLREDVGNPGHLYASLTGNSIIPMKDNYYFSPFENAVEELQILRTEDRIDICFDPRTGTTVPVNGLSRYIAALEQRRHHDVDDVGAT